jgi:tRNA(Ile)-lysidine synthase
VKSRTLPESLLTDEWRQILIRYNTLWVGFSGGMDSTVLLHHLVRDPALIGKLQAVHIHHGLSVYADAWKNHCQQCCQAWKVPLIVRHIDIPYQSNIEEHARRARYQIFGSLLAPNDGLLLAHHADDQAETLLLQLLRGAGIDGLSAMAEKNVLENGERIRPFLSYSRSRLEAYAMMHGLSWIEDDSNQNMAFSRNFLRQKIIPLLQEKWPGIKTNLARTAQHCQHAKDNLNALAQMDCKTLSGDPNNTLAMPPLRLLSHPRLANVLRCWLRHNQVRLPSEKILNQVMQAVLVARSDARPLVQWSDVVVRCYQHTLYLLKKEPEPSWHSMDWSDFPTPLHWGQDKNHRQSIYATVVERGLYVAADQCVQIRFRQGGELFYWRGQRKQLKKLLQEWRIPPWERDNIPLLYIDNELAAVIGFAISDRFFSSSATDPILTTSHRVSLVSTDPGLSMDVGVGAVREPFCSPIYHIEWKREAYASIVN